MKTQCENHLTDRLLSWLYATLLLVGLAACGGGANAPIEPAGPGPAASASIGASGGNLTFTASGVAGSLSIPPGVLQADTLVSVTPLAPSAGEWARVQIQGLTGVLETPVTLTLQLSEAPGPAATGVRVETGGVLPLFTTAGADAGSLVIQLQDFGVAAAAPVAAAARKQALAVRPLASPPPVPPPVAARRQLTPQERLDALRRSIEKHELEVSVHTGLSANLAAASVMQMVGGDDAQAQAALREIAQATDKACTQLRVTLLAATLATVPADLNVRDENESQRWIFRVMAPVLYWQAVVMRLGGDPCQGADVDAVLGAKFTELLNWVKSKTSARHDAVGFGQIVKPLPQAATLAGHARILSAPRLATVVTTNFVEPALVPLRAIAWEAAAATQAHYLLVFSQLNNLYVGPFKDDVQMVRTSLQVQSSRSTGGNLEVLDQASGGAGATPTQTMRDLSVVARSGGQITVNGPIDVLSCPGAAQERLVIEFEGVVVLSRASVGARLLDGPQAFDVDALLQAAGIPATDAKQHRLRVKRVGSSCNPVFGTADEVLATITLEFGTADAITREIQAVKEQMYLNPSDSTLTRLAGLRSQLVARGEPQRAEGVLADPWVNGQLYCVHQRAHAECASGVARTKAESTLGLLVGLSTGSTVLDLVKSLADDSLRVCPFPAFANGGVYAGNAATITDHKKLLSWSIFLRIGNWEGRNIKSFSFQAIDESVDDRRVDGVVPVSGAGPAFSGIISEGNVLGLYGSRIGMLAHQQLATSPTARISVNQATVSGSFDLYPYQEEFEGPLKTANVSFSTTVTLPAAPSASMCNRAALPKPEPD